MGYVLYFGQSIIKCVIAPLFLYIGNYTSLFGGLNNDYIFKGVLLLIYEHLVCTVVIGLSAKRTKVIFYKIIRHLLYWLRIIKGNFYPYVAFIYESHTNG